MCAASSGFETLADHKRPRPGGLENTFFAEPRVIRQKMQSLRGFSPYKNVVGRLGIAD